MVRHRLISKQSLVQTVSEEESRPWSKVIKSERLKIGQKKMRSVKERTGGKRRRNVLLARTETGLHATGALCKHMAWPLAWGGKIEGDCITCPLHQSKYDICSGDVKEWSPFPRLPMYGKILASMRKERPLEVHEARDVDGWVEVRLSL